MIKYFIFQNNTTIFFITSNILINNLFNPINNNTSIYIYNIIINNIITEKEYNLSLMASKYLPSLV